MNKTLLAAFISCALLATSGSALAQSSRGHGDGRAHASGQHSGKHWQKGKDARHGQGKGHDWKKGHDRKAAHHAHRGRDDRHDRNWHRHARPNHPPKVVRHVHVHKPVVRVSHPRWAKGQRVPAYYRTPHYKVADWRAHRLYAPPHGYHWIGVGGDYFLIGMATGVVLHAALSR